MTTGTVRSQGTELFGIDTVNYTDPTLFKMACPTGIQGLGGPRDQIDDTCLDTVGDKTFQAGLGNPGQVTVPFNLIPRDYSHANLFALKEDGTVLNWLACLSEGTDAPTIETDDEFDKPVDRTTIAFSGYVADVNIDIASNDIVKGTLVIQRSGPVVFVPYIPA